jgi:5,5'-dehydrodivanillate O-demethylase
MVPDYEDFAHTGPGTLAGRFMRRFWQPVALAGEVAAGRAVPLKILNEDFTLYRGDNGQAYVVAPRCAHRGTQLSTGWVEGDCLRCFYHGWKYDAAGRCVEQPAEDAAFAGKVSIRAYPTQEYLGLIFAYLGDEQAPALPRHPELEAEGLLETGAYTRDCNYFNNLESNTDELHVNFVHRNSAFTEEGLNRDLPTVSGEETEYGFVKYGVRSDGVVRMSHFFMPNALFIASSPAEGSGWSEHLAWRVPVDDACHRSFQAVLVHLTGEAAERYAKKRDARAAELRQLEPARDVARKLLAGEITWAEVGQRPDIVNIQDNVAQAGQGVIADREHEHLGRSDVVLIMFRQMWRRELKALAEGGHLKRWARSERLAVSSGV